jgi:hypothetical protein
LAYIAAVGIFGLVTPAPAALLIDPSGGLVLLSATTGDSDKDDGTTMGTYYFNGSFFGQAFPYPPTISINGHIRFDSVDGEMGDSFITPLGPGSEITRIAPFWQDLKLGSNGMVIEDIVEGSYYAITWKDLESSSHLGDVDGTASFQVTFFETATTLKGINFEAGDIVFSYGDISIYSEASEVIVGLDSGDGSYADLSALLPGLGLAQGWLSSSKTSFPIGEGQFALFRQDGFNNYEMSAIPEPSTYAAFGSGLVMIGVALRRRRDAKTNA